MIKKTAFRSIALAGGCLVGVVLAEVGLRLSNVWIGRHSDTMFEVIEHDPVVGWKMKRSMNKKVDVVDVEGIPVRTNSLGFWDREFMLKKPPGRCRIAFLGDSFTWGLGVREEERFSNVLADGDSRWESLNFGVPGYGTDQALLLWRQDVRRYKPDVVVLTVYQNDYLDNIYLVRYGRRKPYFELRDEGKVELRNVPVESANFWDDGIYHQVAPPYASFFPVSLQRRSRIAHWLAKNSNLARFIYTTIRVSRTRLPPVREESRHESHPGSPNGANGGVGGESRLDPLQQLQVKLLSALAERLAEDVQATGARFVAVLAGDLIPQFELQMKAFRRAGVIYVDATTKVIASGLPNKDVYYPYSGHWTPGAHRVVAELLAKEIRDMRLCGRGVEP